MDTLIPCLKAVHNEIVISDCIINSEELSQLVKNSKHSNRLWINGCKLTIDTDIDFGNDVQYSIKYLSFRWTGKSAKSDWGKNKSDMKTVMKAICKSSLKDSLQEINVHQCQVTIQEVQQALKDNGLHENIKVTDYNPKVKVD